MVMEYKEIHDSLSAKKQRIIIRMDETLENILKHGMNESYKFEIEYLRALLEITKEALRALGTNNP